VLVDLSLPAAFLLQPDAGSSVWFAGRRRAQGHALHPAPITPAALDALALERNRPRVRHALDTCDERSVKLADFLSMRAR
jgi:hypothetical protein